MMRNAMVIAVMIGALIAMIASESRAQAVVVEWEKQTQIIRFPMRWTSDGSSNSSELSFYDFNNTGSVDIFHTTENQDTVIIYDGSTGAIKFSMSIPGFYIKPICYVDIDNDGVKEFFCQIRQELTWHLVWINVATKTIKYQCDNFTFRNFSFIDIDKDNRIELVGNGIDSLNHYTFRVYGYSSTAIAQKSNNNSAMPRLRGSRPNPFRKSTMIDYFLPVSGNVSITIFDAEGRLVRTLFNSRQKKGNNSILWDGRTDNGIAVATGSYYYSLKVGGKMTVNKKMIVLR